MPDMLMPGMLAMSFFLAGFLLLAAALFFCGVEFLLIPGMFCMSRPACADATKDRIRIRPATAINRDRV